MNRILSWLLRLAALSAVVAVAWVVYLDTKPRQAPVQVAEPQTGLTGEAETSTAAESVQPLQPIAKDEESAPGEAAEEVTAAAPEATAVTPSAAGAGAGPEPAAAPPPDEPAEESAAAAPEATAPEATVVTPPAAGAGAGPEPAAAPSPGEAAGESAVAASEATDSEAAQPPVGASEVVDGSVDREPAAPAEPAEMVVASVRVPSGMESGQPAGEAEQTASAQEPQQDFMARWQYARMAAWQGRLEEAEALFQTLHQERPDDYDLSGELGNVQFALGHLADAAQSYFMTSLRLAADGYDVDAVRLMWTVKRLDPELGARLEHDLLGESAPEGESGANAAGSD